MRNSDDWGNEDWRPENIRANHDLTEADLDREEELERWITRVFILFAGLGIWKLLDLVFGAGSLGAFVGFLGWLFAAIA